MAGGLPRQPSEFKTLYFSSPEEARAALAAFNSSLFYWFLTLLSDCRHLNKREVDVFPVPTRLLNKGVAVDALRGVTRLMKDLKKKQSETRHMKFKHDELTVQCLLPKKSWSVLEGIDELVASAVRLSQVEADYIAGYDVKYRPGQSNDDSDD